MAHPDVRASLSGADAPDHTQVPLSPSSSSSVDVTWPAGPDPIPSMIAGAVESAVKAAAAQKETFVRLLSLPRVQCTGGCRQVVWRGGADAVAETATAASDAMADSK